MSADETYRRYENVNIVWMGSVTIVRVVRNYGEWDSVMPI